MFNKRSGDRKNRGSSSSSRRGRNTNTTDDTNNANVNVNATVNAARSRSPPTLPSQIGVGSVSRVTSGGGGSVSSRSTLNSRTSGSRRPSGRSSRNSNSTTTSRSTSTRSPSNTTNATRRTTASPSPTTTPATTTGAEEEEVEIGYGCSTSSGAYGCMNTPSASQQGFLSFLEKQRVKVQNHLKTATTTTAATATATSPSNRSTPTDMTTTITHNNNATTGAAADRQRQLNNTSAWNQYYLYRNHNDSISVGGGGGGNSGVVAGGNTSAAESTPYQSYRDASSRIYRGFSTPIAQGMFQHVENERLDCCSIACCGILQSDRNRFLIKGVQPPTCFRRFWLHIVLPLTIFGFAGYCAFHIHSIYYNQLIVTALVTSLLSYMVVQCCKGRWKRISVRRELLWRLHHMDRGYDNDDLHHDQFEEEESQASGENYGVPAYLNGQTPNDLWYAHHFCMGCYSTDIPRQTNVAWQHSQEQPTNLCSWLWHQTSKYVLCGCWGTHLQLCGMCGTAQEARELEFLLPASKRRMDYVSMQPMVEYYPKILHLRLALNDNLGDHYRALSQLSKSLITYLGIALGLMLFLSLIPNKNAAAYHHAHQFEWKHFFLLLATFLQSFVLLYFCHWHWHHKFDLSLDAVIKYFASGFLLSTTLAVFFEFVVGIVLKLTMVLIMALLDIDVQTDEDGYSSHTSSSSSNDGGFYYTLVTSNLGGFGHAPLAAAGSGKNYLEAFGKEHPLIFIIYICVTCFVLAALVEELCKYFGYRMVDHPDFHSELELEEAAAERSSGSIPDKAARAAREQQDDDDSLGEIENQRMDFTGQQRSATSLGASITTAMVATALGFACCENLVYVFVYHSHSGFGMQMTVLIVRSLFPIHPIAAGIQSLGVVKRDIENLPQYQLGRIIVPALVLHGSFDFILLLADFLSGLNTSSDNADAAQSRNEWYGLVSLILSFVCMIMGLVYYRKEAQAQRRRLQALDDGTATAALDSAIVDGGVGSSHVTATSTNEQVDGAMGNDGQYRNIV